MSRYKFRDNMYITCDLIGWYPRFCIRLSKRGNVMDQFYVGIFEQKNYRKKTF
jgi:hypothetical protein